MLYSFDQQQRFPLASGSVQTPEATDEVLMERVKFQDQAALECLYKRHQKLIRTIVSRIVSNDADIDELVQEVFCELWNRAGHYSEDKGKALGWLVTLARRRAIDLIRRRQAYQRATDRLTEEVRQQPEEAVANGADCEAADADRAEIFAKVLATLPEAQRETLHLAFYKGMSQRQIAAATNTPLGTIKTRLELAVRKVRKAILAMGGSKEWTLARA